MSQVAQLERATQIRVIQLFREKLGYHYLGNWQDRPNNANIETSLLIHWLKERGTDPALIQKAIHQLSKTAGNNAHSLYERNKDTYELLRYGFQTKNNPRDNKNTVHFIDWEHPENNHFAIAEEVTIEGKDPKSSEKRPDIALYVNGIALAILELKRSSVSVGAGIRQNIENQQKEFIKPFFSTLQWLMAGNDSQGLRYGTIGTPEKYYLTWKEESPEPNLLDKALLQLCNKKRFLELIHDFIVFDSGTKKVCRHNQYFGVKAAQDFVRRKEGGIVWHMQGSGKSLTMVWFAKWIIEKIESARLLIITDRTELDDQIQKVFQGVGESIYRSKSGKDLLDQLNTNTHPILCSLIHKFGGQNAAARDDDAQSYGAYIEELKQSLPLGFSPKGNLHVFVDECHRTQSGELHKAMKAILPHAVFIGFTGTPLLKADKKTSIEVFGRYIHTYKFDEAVRDQVVLDLRYEARDIDQHLSSKEKVDAWFEAKTKGLSDLGKARLKQRWGTMQKVLSSQSRLDRIVADILLDFEEKDRLLSGRGNAMLVSGSIYQACKFFELFEKSPLKGKCAIVTSYRPQKSDIKDENSGEGLTERLRQYNIYRQMLADFFNEPPEKAEGRVEEFEKAVKKKFIDQPGQMQLLIVVDKLLTGFDAPSATYLYIDKQMRDHGLFQAICRVNRLDGEDKDFGFIVDYKDLFKSLKKSIKDYTSEAFDGYDREDVEGLLGDRLEKGRQRLDEALEALRALCEKVEPPQDEEAFFRYFSAADPGDMDRIKANEGKRLMLYTLTNKLIRAYANIAGEMKEAGYSEAETKAMHDAVKRYEGLMGAVKLHSADAVDLKQHEPAMRHLIDAYIRADDSVKLSAFEDWTLVQLVAERGVDEAIKAMPARVRKDSKATAETIENNVRKLIIDETPVNPKYYEKMSELLRALIEQRRQGAIEYRAYLAEIEELARQARQGPEGRHYPKAIHNKGLMALYDNLGKDEDKALAVARAIRRSKQDGWRNNAMKARKILLAIKDELQLGGEDEARELLKIAEKHHDPDFE